MEHNLLRRIDVRFPALYKNTEHASIPMNTLWKYKHIDNHIVDYFLFLKTFR